MNEIEKIINEIADKEIINIEQNGYVMPGNNGPYYCEDTPIRNSSHWIGIYKYLWKKTKNKKYLELIKILADYICSKDFETKSGAIQCMVNNEKMDCLNGSIGQAWTIEGLINACEVLNIEKYYDKAVSIFLSQNYDYQNHLWNRVELNGEDIGKDIVFNHQLWFAASGFLICSYKENVEISKQINDFMNNVNILFDIYDSGLMRHYVRGYEKKEKNFIKKFVREVLCIFSFFDPRFDKYYFEKGYHLFDLYGFAIIYSCNNKFDIFKSNKFKKAISYGLNIKKLNSEFNVKYFLKNKKKLFFKYNKYAYSYNSPAFEYPFVDYIFNSGKNKNFYEELFNNQILMTYDENLKKFNRNTSDSETLTSRLYELTRYLEKEKNDEEK